MDTNRIDRESYIDTLIPLNDEESRYRCLLFLTRDNDHRQMCHDTYNERISSRLYKIPHIFYIIATEIRSKW